MEKEKGRKTGQTMQRKHSAPGNTRTCHSHSNKRNHNGRSSNRSSNRRNALAVTHTDATVMVDNEALYDTCHRNVVAVIEGDLLLPAIDVRIA